jgi:hypothetical protein
MSSTVFASIDLRAAGSGLEPDADAKLLTATAERALLAEDGTRP